MIRSALLLLLFLVLRTTAHGDVTCVDTDDFIGTSLTTSSFIAPSGWTAMFYIKSSGSDFLGNACDEGGFMLGDLNFETWGIGRTGLTGESACAWARNVGDGVTSTPLVAMTPGWHHLAARLSGSTLEVFLNGVSGGTVTLAGGSQNPFYAQPLYLCRVGGSPILGDRVTEVKTYNVTLSTEEIVRQARNRLRVYERTPPTAHWTLEQCGEGATANGVIFPDRSGNNRTTTGNSGGSGLTCAASEFVSRPWGIQ